MELTVSHSWENWEKSLRVFPIATFSRNSDYSKCPWSSGTAGAGNQPHYGGSPGQRGCLECVHDETLQKATATLRTEWLLSSPVLAVRRGHKLTVPVPSSSCWHGWSHLDVLQIAQSVWRKTAMAKPWRMNTLSPKHCLVTWSFWKLQRQHGTVFPLSNCPLVSLAP